MPVNVKVDDVWEVGHGSGIGAMSLGDGVRNGYRSFESVLPDGETEYECVIRILDLTSFAWERCEATYNQSTNTLTRGTLKASSTGSRVDFAAGSKWITMTPSASDIVYQGDIDDAVDAGLALHEITVTGLATGGGALDTDPAISVPRASQAQAEARTDNDTVMTPLRTDQAIDAKVGGAISWRTLATLTPSGVAAVTSTTHLTATYKVYEIELVNVIPVNDNENLYMQVTQGGVAQTSGNYSNAQLIYSSAAMSSPYSPSITQNQEDKTEATLAGAISNAAASNGISGSIFITNPASSTGKKRILYELGLLSASSLKSTIRWEGEVTFTANNTAVDGFSLFFAGSNIASGTIIIRGGL